MFQFSRTCDRDIKSPRLKSKPHTVLFLNKIVWGCFKFEKKV